MFWSTTTFSRQMPRRCVRTRESGLADIGSSGAATAASASAGETAPSGARLSAASDGPRGDLDGKRLRGDSSTALCRQAPVGACGSGVPLPVCSGLLAARRSASSTRLIVILSSARVLEHAQTAAEDRPPLWLRQRRTSCTIRRLQLARGRRLLRVGLDVGSWSMPLGRGAGAGTLAAPCRPWQLVRIRRLEVEVAADLAHDLRWSPAAARRKAAEQRVVGNAR